MIDSSLLMSNAQALTVTAVSTNVIDMLVARDIGADEPLMLSSQIIAGFTGGTSLQVVWQGSFDNTTFFDLIMSPVIVLANLAAPAPLLRCAVPPRGWNATLRAPCRYFRMNYIIVGTMTAGSVSAYLTATPDQEQFYAYNRNYSV